MRFTSSFAILSAATGLVAAQSATSAAATAAATSTGICAQDIVDNCVEQYKKRVDSCNENKANDWVCLCDEYTNYLTCYNNCPSSPDKSPVQNQVTQYCAAAEPLKASLSSVQATASKTSASSSATDSASASASASGSKTSSGVTSASGFSDPSNAAQMLNVPVGGAFAFVLGVAGLL
ncbi:hypothetical protein P280DRAFT_164043 [Massarina eburnea CBS 473.64]|uniref:GPI anchored serine-threonine rich protein n=1 Tax=Massarina eburnea CBS 473.64 TaxID=1395130 RepID=A0A6A6RLA4_9PLEO|nr:hypothetical protein P280DRAFT_164043 [Massarina eburnea CBS 473.64]